MTRNLTRPLTRGLTRPLVRGGGAVPVISGNPYPNETLTSTIAGQWFADDVAIVGETGATITVGLFDIGKKYRCGNSNTLTIWHPNQITGVDLCWVHWSQSFVSTSPDVEASVSETVADWRDIITGVSATQSNSSFRPTKAADGIVFNGSNQKLGLVGDFALDYFREKGSMYIFSAAKSSNPTGGDADHALLAWSRGGSTANRASLVTKGFAGTNKNGAGGRRIDTDSFVQASGPNPDAFAGVFSGEFLPTSGTLRFRKNGKMEATASYATTGPTSNTRSDAASIGSNPAGNNHFPGKIYALIAANQPVSDADRAKIERFLWLNIPEAERPPEVSLTDYTLEFTNLGVRQGYAMGDSSYNYGTNNATITRYNAADNTVDQNQTDMTAARNDLPVTSFGDLKFHNGVLYVACGQYSSDGNAFVVEIDPATLEYITHHDVTAITDYGINGITKWGDGWLIGETSCSESPMASIYYLNSDFTLNKLAYKSASNMTCGFQGFDIFGDFLIAATHGSSLEIFRLNPDKTLTLLGTLPVAATDVQGVSVSGGRCYLSIRDGSAARVISYEIGTALQL